MNGNVTRVLVNTAASLTLTTYQDGTQTDLGTFTIGIVNAAGSAIVDPGTAVVDNGDGSYNYALAAQTALNFHTATWTEGGGQAFTTYAEVVGGHLFTEAALRGFGVKDDSTNKPLASETEYPDSWLRAERDRVTDDLERWTGVSWIPRYARATFAGSGTRNLYLSDGDLTHGHSGAAYYPTSVLAASVGGVALTAGELADIQIDRNLGLLQRKDTIWTVKTADDPRNIVVEWVYGYPALRNGVDRIAMRLALDRLVPSAYPDRALSWDLGPGTVRLVTEGGPAQNRTRIPEVNQWLSDNDHRLIVA